MALTAASRKLLPEHFPAAAPAALGSANGVQMVGGLTSGILRKEIRLAGKPDVGADALSGDQCGLACMLPQRDTNFQAAQHRP